MQVPHIHGVTALCWSPKGSTVAMGTLSGCIMLFTACLKRVQHNSTFEVTQNTVSAANIRHLVTGGRCNELPSEILSCCLSPRNH